MKASDFICIGQIMKPVGFQGNLKLRLDQPLKEDSALASFFVADQPIPIPYFIEEWKALSNELISVKLEDINSEAEAKALGEKKIFLLKQDYEELKIQPEAGVFTVDQLIGLTLLDQNNQKISNIEDVFENTLDQLILQVFVKKQEVLIPFTEERIIDFQPENNILRYEIPDGLMEVYLNPEE